MRKEEKKGEMDLVQGAQGDLTARVREEGVFSSPCGGKPNGGGRRSAWCYFIVRADCADATHR